nr:helix-turn-helix transcriptional regulator [Escherichia coli]
MSEISVRKKLEAENTNFYQVLLDCRMAKAARLILDENNHINKITTMVGMSSASYFIKAFSSYYGITPKQFSSIIRNDKSINKQPESLKTYASVCSRF